VSQESIVMAAGTTHRTYEGWFTTAARLVVAEAPQGAWTVESGQHTVIVVYSSERQRGAFDKGVFNDELVLEISANDAKPGATFDLAACNARYQRGGTKLEYVSRAVTGELRMERVEARVLRGSFTLRATAPQLDLRSLGDVESVGVFQIEPHTP
jgi:hypothetical protein